MAVQSTVEAQVGVERRYGGDFRRPQGTFRAIQGQCQRIGGTFRRAQGSLRLWGRMLEALAEGSADPGEGSLRVAEKSAWDRGCVRRLPTPSAAESSAAL